MARSLGLSLIFAVTLTSSIALPPAVSTARAGELDKKGRSDAREAMRLYKEGNYEDAAKVFARLSVNYPDMLVFVRNLGACYYYLRRWEPAISNLRDYEHRKKDIAADDHAEISGWIGEMERLRDQATAHAAPTPAPTAPAVPDAVAPAAAAVPVPSAAVIPPAPSSESQPPSSASSAVTDATSAAPASAGTTFPVPAATTEPAPAQTQPYPPAQWGSQSTYPPGPYGAQPTYPQPQYPYGQPSPYPYQTNPSATPQGYAPYAVAPPAGAVAASPPGRSSGRKVAAWILGITGVGAVGVGAVCTFKALDDFSKVEKKYDPTLEDEGKKFATAQWVGYGVGGALLVTAIIVGSSGGASVSGVALAPAVGPGTAGATLAGAF